MMTSRLIAGSFCAALLAVGLLGTGVASANPPPSPPGPGQPGYCGAHTSPLDCWANTGPMTPVEAAFINKINSYDIAGMPTDSTRLLQIARGTCQMLVGGTTTQYVVEELRQERCGSGSDHDHRNGNGMPWTERRHMVSQGLPR